MTLYIIRREHYTVYRYGSLTVWNFDWDDIQTDDMQTSRGFEGDEPWCDSINGQIFEEAL